MIESAWAGYSNDVADARATQTLDDALSANDAWHDVHLAAAVKFVHDADAWNAYEDAVVPLVGDFVTLMESAWVDYAGKFAGWPRHRFGCQDNAGTRGIER